jgi:hypothetical protein
MAKKEKELLFPSTTMVKIRRKVLNVKASITCSVCGKLHEVGSVGYVVIYGDIEAGDGEVIVGPNLDAKGKVDDAAVFCQSDACLGPVVKKMMGNEK